VTSRPSKSGNSGSAASIGDAVDSSEDGLADGFNVGFLLGDLLCELTGLVVGFSVGKSVSKRPKSGSDGTEKDVLMLISYSWNISSS